MNVDRRTFLALAGGGIAARAQQPATRLDVLVNEEIGKISPLIYGQFAEHVGNLIYDGIWVGPSSGIRNRQGLRLDTLEALQKIQPGVVRWPGGCFADAYHWEEAVGPPASRIHRRNHWWNRDEPNTFGTDEFLAWCRLLGTQPYLSVNVGSGSVAEALNWVEYCNGTGSHYADLRARNGHAEPYGVKWWGIGNENWGCGGLFTASEYAQQFREYSIYFKRFGMSDDKELVGVGHTPEWNQEFLDKAGPGLPYLNHLSIHHYFRRGRTTQFSDDEYHALMRDLTPFEEEIRTAISALQKADQRRAKIAVFGTMKLRPLGLVIDEWGVWDSESTPQNNFLQNGPLREALFAASCLNLFQRYCDRISMTNIAQAINVLQALIITDGPSMILTPTYHVYRMYLPHQNATCVRTEPREGSISVSASKAGNRLFVTLANSSLTEDVDLEVTIRGGKPSQVEATNLTAASVRTQNTLEHPDAASPRPWKARIGAPGLILNIPAKSVQAVSIGLA